MKAKDYLKELKKLDIKISQKSEQLEQIGKSKQSDKSEMTELYQEINNTIYEYEKAKNKIVNEIHMLDNTKHIELLYMRYVKCFDLQKIAEQMNYSHDRIKHLHSAALKEFQNKILNPNK